MVAQTLGFILLVAVVLFGAAGQILIPLFWAYLGVLAAVSVAGLLIDEDLARERMRPGGLIFMLCVAHWTIAGLNCRFHWSDTVPPSLRIAALAVFAAGLALFIWAMHVNRFSSSVVRIQQERGHQVVTAGPYRWVRHPGYAGAIPAIVASGMALCSWLAKALGALGVPLLLWRTIIEDRTLRAELPRYAEYAQQVRWRLLPGVW
jgi:protein-S-isoprenylcysteine O-methyltransferase Ste14